MSHIKPFEAGSYFRDIEAIIHSLPMIQCKFFEGQREESTSLLLPLANAGSCTITYFLHNGRESYAPVGLLHRSSFLGRDNYRLNNLGFLVGDDGKSQVLYLPVIRTTFTVEVDIPDSTPYAVMGIELDDQKLPLILSSPTDEGIKVRGIYLTPHNSIQTFVYPALDEHPAIKIWVNRFMKPSQTTKKSKLIQTTQPLTTSQKDHYISENDLEINWENPRSIVDYLDQYIIGQDEAKKTVAVAFSNYMIRYHTKDESLPKENILLVGGTGVGKTYMISLLAKKADLPVVESKISTKSAEGFKGENISTIFEQLKSKTKDEAPYAIVFLDEVDKLVSDVSGTSVGQRLQDHLIAWLEEDVIMGSGDNQTSKSPLNTKNILFVAAGAFSGEGHSLEDIVKKRRGINQKKMGFGTLQETEKPDSYLTHVQPEDIIRYGLKPELVGRLPAIAILNPLTTEDKVRIIKESRGSQLGKYLRLLEVKGYEVELEEPVYRLIAEAYPKETGARALSSVCSDLFTEVNFDPERYVSNGRVIITPQLAKQLISHYDIKEEKPEIVA